MEDAVGSWRHSTRFLCSLLARIKLLMKQQILQDRLRWPLIFRWRYSKNMINFFRLIPTRDFC